MSEIWKISVFVVWSLLILVGCHPSGVDEIQAVSSTKGDGGNGFMWKNTTDEVVRITGIEASCGCMAADFKNRLKIAPGSEYFVGVSAAEGNEGVISANVVIQATGEQSGRLYLSSHHCSLWEAPSGGVIILPNRIVLKHDSNEDALAKFRVIGRRDVVRSLSIGLPSGQMTLSALPEKYLSNSEIPDLVENDFVIQLPASHSKTPIEVPLVTKVGELGITVYSDIRKPRIYPRQLIVRQGAGSEVVVSVFSPTKGNVMIGDHPAWVKVNALGYIDGVSKFRVRVGDQIKLESNGTENGFVKKSVELRFGMPDSTELFFKIYQL